VLIAPWVPQTAVLGHAAVKGFLCHGGHTTTNEALATGTPMLCMPFGGDQLVVAQHIKDHGYGLQVRRVVLMRLCALRSCQLPTVMVAVTTVLKSQIPDIYCY
jgi:UDP:flavonoid glycosyltransferase YjiC (YdhE family)